jgi:hypothetical protein
MNEQENNHNPDSGMPVDHKFDMLIYAYFEGTLGSEDAVVLTGYLRDPRNVKYFVERCKQEQVMYDLISSNAQQQSDDSCSFESGVWQELAKYEDHAPAVAFERVVEPAAVEHLPPVKIRRVNKTSLVTILVSVAALLLMFAYVNLSSYLRREPVASLVESMNPQWSANYTAGDIFLRSEALIELRSGIARLKFNSGAETILEGPCTFSCLSTEQIGLHSGKLYVRVPKGAEGFTVKTATTKIIDLGTEFGVDMNTSGQMGLYMYKGKASLITTPTDKKDVTSLILKEGQAKQVNCEGEVSELEFVLTKFIRQFNLKHNIVWKGEPLRLASILSGGNGFTPGDVQNGIDPATGQLHQQVVQEANRQGWGYKPVQGHSFIDGVFIPNGARGVNTVSSAGHTFNDFPVTDGYYWADITANPYITQYTEGLQKLAVSSNPADAKTGSEDFIVIHSNAAITFDLDKIRQVVPNEEISQFKARCGVSQNATKKMQAEFWVLLDGQCVFHSKTDKIDRSLKEVAVSVGYNQRFLTLAVTDGMDGIPYDWCFFADPVLELNVRNE